MTVIGLNVGYADYTTETELLAQSGIKFHQLTSVDEIADKSAVTALMVRQVPVDAATARGVHVCNTPDYGQAHEVSDDAVALYLALSAAEAESQGVHISAWKRYVVCQM